MDKIKKKKILTLEEEIQKKKEKYQSLLKELSLFASNGDLSENADWSLVNERKEVLLQEIIQKELLLKNLKNNTIKKQEVVYLILNTKEEKRVIISEEDSDPTEGVISFESFLGETLEKTKEGEKNWVICAEEKSYEIKVISKKHLC